MFSLRTNAIVFFAVLAANIWFVVAGNALQSAGIESPEILGTPAKILFLVLATALAFSAVPLMVKIVLGFQKTIGNENIGAVRAAIANERRIILILWGLMAAGLLFAIPAAIKDGSFDFREARSEGRLVARPNMLVSEMIRQSSLKLERNSELPAQNINPLPIAGGAVFDFEIAGTGFVIPACRYYFVSTYTHNPGRIEAINVGTSPHKVSRAELEAASSNLRARLAASGWVAGHEEYRTAEDRTLHGGDANGAEDRHWLKDDVVLDIESRRMDDPAPGEDEASAGEWIQFVEVWPRTEYPGIERLVFTPPK